MNRCPILLDAWKAIASDAVKLDSDYITTWKQLANTTDNPAARDQAELNLLRLDPRQKHDGADLSTVSDLRALWAAAAAKWVPPVASSLSPLEASTALLQRQRALHPPPPTTSGGGPDEPADFADQGNERLSPRSAVLKNKLVTQALMFLPRNNTGVPM